MEIKVQLSEAFKAMEDVNDSLFEDIKPISVLKEGYIKKCHGKCFCSTDMDNWEECSEEEFDELKHGGYSEIECDCEECSKENLDEQLTVDLKDDNEVFLAQKIIDLRKERDQEDIEEIVDMEAKDDEEAADTPHVGKVVLRCNTCGTPIYINEEDIEKDPNNPEVVNKDLRDCPYCHDSTGWEIVGRIEPVAEPEVDNPESDVELSESISKKVFDAFKEDEFFKQFSDNAIRQFINIYLDFTGEYDSNIDKESVKEFMNEEGLGVFALDNFDKLRFLTFKQVGQADPKFMEAVRKFYPELEEDDDAIDMTFKELSPEELKKTLEDVKKIYLELTEDLREQRYPSLKKVFDEKVNLSEAEEISTKKVLRFRNKENPKLTIDIELSSEGENAGWDDWQIINAPGYLVADDTIEIEGKNFVVHLDEYKEIVRLVPEELDDDFDDMDPENIPEGTVIFESLKEGYKLVKDLTSEDAYEYIQYKMSDNDRKELYKKHNGRYPKDMDEFWDWAEQYCPIDESLKEDKSKKWAILFSHSNPESTYIVDDYNEAKERVRLSDWYAYPIEPIQSGKKSLIANNDEDAYEVLANVTDKEWLQLLKEAYKEYKEKFDEYDGEAENIGPCGLSFDDEFTEEEFIDYYNNWIEKTEVDRDSSSQYIWYEGPATKVSNIFNDADFEEEEFEESLKEDEDKDVEIKDLKESRFDSLVNQYLRDIYENVESYTTKEGTVDDTNNKLIVEGVIKFKSGKEKDTKFIFEAKTITSKNQIRFVGLNESFSKSKNAFILKTKLVDDTLFCESLSYDYLPLNAVLTEGKLTEDSRVSGKVVNVKEMVFEKRAKILEAKTKKLVEANKDLRKVEGTVAYVLNKYNSDLWAHKSDVEGMREAVLKLLDSEEIKDKETAEEAKKILSKAKPNLFLSTLATYITGLRTAPKKDKKPTEEPKKEEPKEEEKEAE